MVSKLAKPKGLKNEHLIYLDDLRESGETNMYGARPYLQAMYLNLSDEKASAILLYWMKTFAERHGIKKAASSKLT